MSLCEAIYIMYKNIEKLCVCLYLYIVHKKLLLGINNPCTLFLKLFASLYLYIENTLAYALSKTLG